MARLLYAAAGDGFGHATRAHSVGLGLMNRGHEVCFLGSRKSTAYLAAHFPGLVHDIFGLNMTYRDGEVEVLDTVTRNIRNAWRQLKPSNRVIRRVLREFAPDLVITDYEPFSAFWCWRWRIPFISLDNQHLLTHCQVYHPPGNTRDLINAYLVTRLYFAGARRYLITTFLNPPIRYHPARLVAPIIRPAVYERKPDRGDYLLAYKGAGGPFSAMAMALESFTGMPIRAYGFDRDEQQGHITYRKHDTESFLDDLCGCAGVVATAGHSLVCECLHLEKPMLVMPIARQYEQVLNAYYVDSLGYGKWARGLDVAQIESFVTQLDAFSRNIAELPKACMETVLDEIESNL